MKGLFGLVLLSLATNCSKKADANERLVRSKLMFDKKVWMTENLNIDISESYGQGDDTRNGKRFGRLYTWEAAHKGCAELGEGWRLPTDEEWRTMAKHYGGIYDDADDHGKSAYVNLSEGGSAGFNAVLGGNREPDGNYKRLGAHGFYWTSTAYDSAEAWFYNFGRESGLLNHHTGSKERAISVRCIRKSQ